MAQPDFGLEYDPVTTCGYVNPAVSIVAVLGIAATALGVALRAVERKEIH